MITVLGIPEYQVWQEWKWNQAPGTKPAHWRLTNHACLFFNHHSTVAHMGQNTEDVHFRLISLSHTAHSYNICGNNDS